jgi:hypothetical protein
MKKKLDAEAILRKLAELRKSIPGIDNPRRPPSADRRTPAVETQEGFEYAAVADALESVASDVHAAVERAN